MNFFTKESLFSLIVSSLLMTACAHAQELQTVPQDAVVAPAERGEYYTYKWEGERYPDGRPRVSDDLLERLKEVNLEDAWQLLHEMGYRNQFEGGWKMVHDDVPFVGRALTAVYTPARPDVQERLVEEGLEAGHIGSQNSWPIDMLQDGDVYLGDTFGKIAQGTMIGDKLGNSIFARTGTGVIFDASVRDLEALKKIEGFNAFVRDFHPSFLEEVMLVGINVPAQIGNVTVMPADATLAKQTGIVVIPPHLLEQVVITAEIIALRDEFTEERIYQRGYTAGQVDSRWTLDMEERSEEHTSELQSRGHLVCRLLLEKKKTKKIRVKR